MERSSNPLTCRKIRHLVENEQDSIVISMQLLLESIKGSDKTKIKEVFKLLAGKGCPMLIVIFSLPFCIPIQIPGFSTPFGVILAFLGLRIAFGKKVWWPNWILEKELQTKHIEFCGEKVIQMIQMFKKFLHPRLLFLIQNHFFYRLHGILIFILAILLSLPLPIPFSNMLAASPIFLIGLGLLEDDGLLIILGYCIALICFLAFFGLYLLGKAQFALFF